MTRLEEAKKWWEKNVGIGDKRVPHGDIPLRYMRALRKAGYIKYEYRLFWHRKMFKADRDKGFEAFDEALK